jgi:hypothetical protein
MKGLFALDDSVPRRVEIAGDVDAKAILESISQTTSRFGNGC